MVIDENEYINTPDEQTDCQQEQIDCQFNINKAINYLDDATPQEQSQFRETLCNADKASIQNKIGVNAQRLSDTIINKLKQVCNLHVLAQDRLTLDQETKVQKYDEDSKTYLSVKNSQLLEDVGMIELILSDKTGTLTCNIMNTHYNQF